MASQTYVLQLYNKFECQCQHVESMIFEMTIYLWYCEYSSLGQGGINPDPAGLREPELGSNPLDGYNFQVFLSQPAQKYSQTSHSWG